VQSVNHTYSFFDFQPQVPDSITFEPCVMLPGVRGCECLKLGCAVDQHNFRPQLEQSAAAAEQGQLTFNVSRRACAAPAGYVRESAHRASIAGACARPPCPICGFEAPVVINCCTGNAAVLASGEHSAHVRLAVAASCLHAQWRHQTFRGRESNIKVTSSARRAVQA
jgi:hypothetical protein